MSQRILSGQFERPEVWFKLSPSAQRLMCGLLEPDPRRRIACEELLVHSWLLQHVL